MKKMAVNTLLVLLMSLLTAVVQASEDEQITQLRDTLTAKMPGLEITRISQTDIPGVLELLSGGDIYYLTPDAKYMLQGALIDLEKQVNITNQRRGAVHIGMINAMPEDKMVVFSPKEEKAERAITVFTDTSCPYCSKLHAEIDQFTDAGIKVRYLLYPRAGLGSAAYKQLQSVWCADDSLAAMTAAKQGESITEKACENPIQEHIKLAQDVGLRGTPLIYLDSGEIVSGYRPAEQLVKIINNSEPVK